MNKILWGVVGIILLAVIEQLVAWIMENIFAANSIIRKHLPALIIAVIVLAVIVVTLPVGDLLSSATPTPQAGLLYQLTVQDSESQDGIENADVTLTVPGVSPFRATTDANGLAVMEDLPDDILGKTAVLTITAENYEPHRLNVAVNLNQLPKLITLEKR